MLKAEIFWLLLSFYLFIHLVKKTVSISWSEIDKRIDWAMN